MDSEEKNLIVHKLYLHFLECHAELEDEIYLNI